MVSVDQDGEWTEKWVGCGMNKGRGGFCPGWDFRCGRD